jgi:hypothetical protein
MAEGAPKDGKAGSDGADGAAASESFDVVLIHGKTDDGAGAKVLRARPGRLDAGEMRPMQDGKPLGSGEIVRLERRPGSEDAPPMFDVHVEHKLEPQTRTSDKPAQVATPAYRESWERTFGRGRADAPN